MKNVSVLQVKQTLEKYNINYAMKSHALIGLLPLAFGFPLFSGDIKKKQVEKIKLWLNWTRKNISYGKNNNEQSKHTLLYPISKWDSLLQQYIS